MAVVVRVGLRAVLATASAHVGRDGELVSTHHSRADNSRDNGFFAAKNIDDRGRCGRVRCVFLCPICDVLLSYLKGLSKGGSSPLDLRYEAVAPPGQRRDKPRLRPRSNGLGVDGVAAQGVRRLYSGVRAMSTGLYSGQSCDIAQ